MTNKTDRRIIRTKKDIKDTFISLLQEKSFEKISVRDLTERANINRGTFYLHYLDKYDLLEKLENEIFEKVQTIIDSFDFQTQDNVTDLTKERIPFLIQLLQIFKDEAAFMKVILSTNGDANFQEKIRKVFLYNWENIIPQTIETDKLNYPIELIIAYISSAHLGVLTYWLQNDLKQSPEEIANMLLDNIVKGPLAASGLEKMFLKN